MGISVVFDGPLHYLSQVRLQTQPKVMPGERPLYNGLFDCAKKTVVREVVMEITVNSTG